VAQLRWPDVARIDTLLGFLCWLVWLVGWLGCLGWVVAWLVGGLVKGAPYTQHCVLRTRLRSCNGWRRQLAQNSKMAQATRPDVLTQQVVIYTFAVNACLSCCQYRTATCSCCTIMVVLMYCCEGRITLLGYCPGFWAGLCCAVCCTWVCCAVMSCTLGVAPA
jgi:hypothetical protein